MFEDEKYMDADKLVDEVLHSEPKFMLSANFAEKVAQKVERKFEWIHYFKEFLIYLGVIFGINAIAAGMAFIWYKANVVEWLAFLQSNISWVAGIYLVVVFILFIDRVVLRYYLFKSSVKLSN